MTRSNPTDEVRMSFGDHLEELRRRLIYALLGVAATVTLCLAFGVPIIKFLVTPYVVAMTELGFEPHMIQLAPTEMFMEYFKICFKLALVVSAPWALYQIWLFIAAGLYPAERRMVRLFAPTSIALFVAGASFMVVVVLLGLMKFLIGVAMWFPMPQASDSWFYRFLSRGNFVTTAPASQPSATPLRVPILDVNPETTVNDGCWINTLEKRFYVQAGGVRHYARLDLADREQFVEPLLSVSEYMGFVVDLSLAFGLGFQIPVVVIFLVAVRLVTADRCAASRRYVILSVCVIAAVLTPSPDAGTMMLLVVPMVLLFEIGVLIGRVIERHRSTEEAAV